MAKKKIIIIDAFALIFRAYYALPPLTNKDGTVVNAVYGFFNTIFNIYRDYKPDYLCVAFDMEKPTFRKEMYKEYKAQREAPPEDFKPQIPIITNLLKHLNIQTYGVPGFEADDVIGSICATKSIDNKDTISYILTGDLDTLQLVDDNTKVITFKKGMSETLEYDEEAVEKKYDGIKPAQVIEIKALKGDASDNIPGVKGIGEKGAIKLIKEFGSLDGVYENIESDKITDRVREMLKEQKEMAYISKKLSTIVTDIDLSFKLEDCKPKEYDQDKVMAELQHLEFKSLINKMPQFGEKKIANQKPSEEIRKPEGHTYKTITSESDFTSFLTELKNQKEFVFDTETTSLDPFNAELLGISFSWQEDVAFYLAITSKSGDGLFEDSTTNSQWLNQLKPIFADEAIKKIGHNLKYDIEILDQQGFEVKGIHFDTMVGAYLLSAGDRTYDLDSLSFREFGYKKIAYNDLVGTGKEEIKLIDVPLTKLGYYSCEDADFTYRLYKKFSKTLKDEGMSQLMAAIEMPLVEVLITMEENGVLIDPEYLKKLSQEAEKSIERLEKEIYKVAGEEFNIASPNQLQEVLFDKLQLSTQGIAKTKTGYSTAASELEKLHGLHPIIDSISEYRELAKLKSTYLDALPELINKKTGRIHTSFNQTITATGRLSSTNPNVQNIPIRSELGRMTRKAFIAPQGFKIVSADYSQIEIRLVAHYSQDSNLLKIFKEGKDVHTSTAAQIHGITEEEVTKQIRSTAKEVNFGIIYGLGPFGLAQRTGLTREEAKKFIEKYFEKFPGIKKYIDEAVSKAKEFGYAETLFGRRRYLPDLNSNAAMMRSAAERIAVNMPLQGTAADLIKIAMIRVQEKLNEISPNTKMILQVHDELVFEVPEADVEKVSKFVKETMEKAHTFTVPIIVDVNSADNWGELK